MARMSLLLMVAAFFLPFKASFMLAVAYIAYMVMVDSPKGINPFEDDDRKERK